MGGPGSGRPLPTKPTELMKRVYHLRKMGMKYRDIADVIGFTYQYAHYLNRQYIVRTRG